MRLVLVISAICFNLHNSCGNQIVYKDKGVFNPLITDEFGKPVAEQDGDAGPIEEVVLPQRAPIPAGPNDVDIMPEVPNDDCPPGKIKVSHTNQGDSECVDSVNGCGPEEMEVEESGSVLCVPRRSGEIFYAHHQPSGTFGITFSVLTIFLPFLVSILMSLY